MKKENAKKNLGNLCLLLAALIWGVAFVAQSVGMDYIGPLTFNGIRSLMASAVLLPCALLLDRRKTPEQRAKDRRSPAELWKAGCLCGLALFAGSALQQMGLAMGTTAGKAGFITALYIVLVPLFGLFLHRRVPGTVWISILLAAVGLYLLCMTGTLSLSVGDLLVLLCAVAYTCHILLIDHFSSRVDCVRMSCIQFLVAGVLSLVVMAFTERPTIAGIIGAAVPLVYAGVFSGAVAYTLQILGQRDTEPAVASLLMSLESVFSVLAGWIILNDRLSAAELCGCALMFAAIVLAQRPPRTKGASAGQTAA